jgi:hypothetical protein
MVYRYWCNNREEKYMTPDELERLFAPAEGPTLEFKCNVPDLDDHHPR